MYKRILVTLENSAYDDLIVSHVGKLAKLCGSSIVLIHDMLRGSVANKVRHNSLIPVLLVRGAPREKQL